MLDAALQEQQTPTPDRQLVETADVSAVNRSETRALYQKRQQIYAKSVRGGFRRLKWILMAVTLGIYYLGPWLRWDRGENAPGQAILLDFPGRRFYFFFIEIWPQEVYYITGLLIIAAISLFLATSLAGRLWCGYACPQTVWTDLFMAFDRLVEGDRVARMHLDKAPWSANKLARKVLKHGIWVIVGVLTGGAWVFYFADAPTLAGQLWRFEAPMVAYIFIALLTFTTYLLGGLAREQVCIYMCPWPRIQGAMLDEETLTVTYRSDRGEPRGPYRKGDSWQDRGQCVDCRQCIVVCPTGIDIRDGLQLECISCGLCIDACNNVMRRVGQKTGLVAYDTEGNIERRQRGEPARFRPIRVRTLVYAGLVVLVGAVMLVALLTRGGLDVNVLRDRNPLFITLSDGSIRNGFTVKILNKRHQEGTFELTVEGLKNPHIKTSAGQPELRVPPDMLRSFRVFVSLPAASLTSESTPIRFVVRDSQSAETSLNDSTFRGPKQ